jgi:hypothetical protein
LVWHVSRTADSCSGIFTRAVFKVTVIASWEFDDSIFSIKTRIYRNSPLLFNYWLGLFWVFQVIYNVAHPGAISVSFQVNEVIILLCLSNSDHPTFEVLNQLIWQVVAIYGMSLGRWNPPFFLHQTMKTILLFHVILAMPYNDEANPCFEVCVAAGIARNHVAPAQSIDSADDSRCLQCTKGHVHKA